MEQLHCKIGKLHYKVHGKSPNESLKYLYDDDGVRDLVYPNLHDYVVYMYVEYHGDEDEETILKASIETQVGDKSILEGYLKAKETKACIQLMFQRYLTNLRDVVAYLIVETLSKQGTRINQGSWEVALSNDEDK